MTHDKSSWLVKALQVQNKFLVFTLTCLIEKEQKQKTFFFSFFGLDASRWWQCDRMAKLFFTI